MRALRWTLRRAWMLLVLVPVVTGVGLLDPRLLGALNRPMALPIVESQDAQDAPPPPARGALVDGAYLFTPDELRAAYGVSRLLRSGYDGKGQSVVVVECYGNPDLQRDMAVFDARYGLPPADVQVLAPLGTVPFDANDTLMRFWARETMLDVEVVHAIAPGAKIVVLTSPVAENQGTSGLPEFLQLERYAVDNHRGSVISQSWGASEVTLGDEAGKQEVARWDAFFQAATRAGVTFFASSGDHGATDYSTLDMRHFSPTPTTNFPAADPWVTSVGGTALSREGDGFVETGWGGSGGGFSGFFPAPAYQRALPSPARDQLAGRRGVPDVAASAAPSAGLGYYVRGEWHVARGTSASAPLWAGLTAIANQMAGRPLGFLNPALYELARAPASAGDFRDITGGYNGYFDNGMFVLGYSAAPGWDAVTGLGAPDAERLLPDLIAAIRRERGA